MTLVCVVWFNFRLCDGNVQDLYSLVVLIVEIVVLIIVGTTINPEIGSFVTYDATISFTYYKDSRIPYFVAILVPLFCLLLSFAVLEYSLARVKQNAAQAVGVCTVFFLDFVGAGVVNGLITEVTKNLVGRYRPDWLSRCQPDIDNPVDIAGFGLSPEDNPACTSDLPASKISDGRKSFPSGHASTAFSLGVFSSGYCTWVLVYRWHQHRNSRLTYQLGRQGLFLWILCQIGWAWGVAISRIMDNKHHESDVIGGAFLGTCIAVVFLFKSVQQCHDMQLDHDDDDEMEISLGQHPSL